MWQNSIELFFYILEFIIGTLLYDLWFTAMPAVTLLQSKINSSQIPKPIDMLNQAQSFQLGIQPPDRFYWKKPL